MTLTNEQLEKFLELVRTTPGPDAIEFDIISKTHKINHYISQAVDIAPLAARKLIKANELLMRLLPSLEWDVETQNPSSMKQICEEVKQYLGK